MCWGLHSKLDPCDTDSEMFSTHTKAPTVTFSTWVRSRVTPNHCGGHFQQLLTVWCPLEDISLLPVPFSLSLRSLTNCWPTNVKNYSHIHSGNYCPGCISRFKKITDNKSSAFPLCIRWYLHFHFTSHILFCDLYPMQKQSFLKYRSLTIPSGYKGFAVKLLPQFRDSRRWTAILCKFDPLRKH